MEFKDILVLFTEPRHAESGLEAAVKLARLDDAHLVGLYLMPHVTLFGGGMPYSGSVIEIQTLEEIEAQRRAAAANEAAEMERHFRDAARREGLSEEWRTAEGDAAATAVVQARHADIAVLGQADPEHPVAHAHNLVESVLLGAGRPALVVPYVGRFDTVGRNVLVAWNGSRESARAVNDALPILTRAEKVIVYNVNPPDDGSTRPAWPGADIALHLARHGVATEASSTVSHDIDVGNTILSRAADFGSDLIVMGGYGHSRQRELILGGVTRTLLQHMTVPVLFSH